VNTIRKKIQAKKNNNNNNNKIKISIKNKVCHLPITSWLPNKTYLFVHLYTLIKLSAHKTGMGRNFHPTVLQLQLKHVREKFLCVHEELLTKAMKNACTVYTHTHTHTQTNKQTNKHSLKTKQKKLWPMAHLKLHFPNLIHAL